MSTNYGSSLAMFDNADPEGAALLMGARGYHGADPELYASSMKSLYHEFFARDVIDKL
jgi:hypothetical protein